MVIIDEDYSCKDENLGVNTHKLIEHNEQEEAPEKLTTVPKLCGSPSIMDCHNVRTQNLLPPLNYSDIGFIG